MKPRLAADGTARLSGDHQHEEVDDRGDIHPVINRGFGDTEIVDSTHFAVSPAPARCGEGDKSRELNGLFREMALDMPRVGQAQPELFVKDRAHFSAAGYERLVERVRPFLAR